MEVKVEKGYSGYTICYKEEIGKGYSAVQITKNAYIGIKHKENGFTEYDLINKQGKCVFSFKNSKEMYIHAYDINTKDSSHFDVTYHNSRSGIETSTVVSYDYNGKLYSHASEENYCKSNREVFENSFEKETKEFEDSVEDLEEVM